MNSSFSIRKASSSDFVEVNELMAELGYPTDQSQNEEREKTFELVLENPAQEIFVICENGKKEILGTITYSILPRVSLCGLKMEITEVVVSSKKRGAGLGTQLIHFAIDQAKRGGAKKVLLSTNRARESYQRSFYKKLGFTEKNSAFFELTP